MSLYIPFNSKKSLTNTILFDKITENSFKSDKIIPLTLKDRQITDFFQTYFFVKKLSLDDGLTILQEETYKAFKTYEELLTQIILNILEILKFIAKNHYEFELSPASIRALHLIQCNNITIKQFINDFAFFNLITTVLLYSEIRSDLKTQIIDNYKELVDIIYNKNKTSLNIIHHGQNTTLKEKVLYQINTSLLVLIKANILSDINIYLNYINANNLVSIENVNKHYPSALRIFKIRVELWHFLLLTGWEKRRLIKFSKGGEALFFFPNLTPTQEANPYFNSPVLEPLIIKHMVFFVKLLLNHFPTIIKDYGQNHSFIFPDKIELLKHSELVESLAEFFTAIYPHTKSKPEFISHMLIFYQHLHALAVIDKDYLKSYITLINYTPLNTIIAKEKSSIPYLIFSQFYKLQYDKNYSRPLFLNFNETFKHFLKSNLYKQLLEHHQPINLFYASPFHVIEFSLSQRKFYFRFLTILNENDLFSDILTFIKTGFEKIKDTPESQNVLLNWLGKLYSILLIDNILPKFKEFSYNLFNLLKQYYKFDDSIINFIQYNIDIYLVNPFIYKTTYNPDIQTNSFFKDNFPLFITFLTHAKNTPQNKLAAYNSLLLLTELLKEDPEIIENTIIHTNSNTNGTKWLNKTVSFSILPNTQKYLEFAINSVAHNFNMSKKDVIIHALKKQPTFEFSEFCIDDIPITMLSLLEMLNDILEKENEPELDIYLLVQDLCFNLHTKQDPNNDLLLKKIYIIVKKLKSVDWSYTYDGEKSLFTLISHLEESLTYYKKRLQEIKLLMLENTNTVENLFFKNKLGGYKC